jgi:hypothetical protein
MPVQSYLHNIYGGGRTYYTQHPLSDDKCCFDALIALSALFSAIENAVELFFPSTSIMAPMIAPMVAKATVSNKVFVRITWRQQYPGVVFHPDSLLQRLQIKDIYLQFGMDYSNDPLFNDELGKTLV